MCSITVENLLQSPISFVDGLSMPASLINNGDLSEAELSLTEINYRHLVMSGPIEKISKTCFSIPLMKKHIYNRILFFYI